MKVTDPSGIRRVEIVDATGAPTVVGAEDYDTDAGGVQTDRGASCNFRFASPCPQLSYGETLRATSLQAGRRKLLVRAYDAGGNVVERGPYEAEVVSPSDRGALNGGNATEGGSISARFTRGNSRTRRTIGFLSKADVAGQLLNDGGQPITNARVAVLTRDIDDDDAKLRTYVTTDGEGRFSLPGDGLRLAAVPVRLDLARQRRPLRRQRLRHAARPRDGELDAEPAPGAASAASSGSTGGWPASARAAASTSSRRAASGSRGRFRTFADGTIGRDGRFRVSYRFRDPSSRGRTFQFRIKIERDSGFAYWGGYSRVARVRVR